MNIYIISISIHEYTHTHTHTHKAKRPDEKHIREHINKRRRSTYRLYTLIRGGVVYIIYIHT